MLSHYQVEENEWLAVHPPHLASPYGLLRSPWNYNPSPVLTRYNNMHQIQFNNVVATAKIFYMGSDCAEYQSFVKKYAVGQTYETYLTESEDNVHGKVGKTEYTFFISLSCAISYIFTRRYHTIFCNFSYTSSIATLHSHTLSSPHPPLLFHTFCHSFRFILPLAVREETMLKPLMSC